MALIGQFVSAGGDLTSDALVNPTQINHNVTAGQFLFIVSYGGTACSDTSGTSYTLLVTDGPLVVFYGFAAGNMMAFVDTVDVTGSHGFGGGYGTADATAPIGDYQHASGTWGPFGSLSFPSQTLPAITVPAAFRGSIVAVGLSHAVNDNSPTFQTTNDGSGSLVPGPSGSVGDVFGFGRRPIVGGNTIWYWGASAVHTVNASNTGSDAASTTDQVSAGVTVDWALFCILIWDVPGAGTGGGGEDGSDAGKLGNWNLATDPSWYHQVFRKTGRVKFQRTDLPAPPPFTVDVFATTPPAGKYDTPGKPAMDVIRRLHISFQRLALGATAGDILLVTSDDDGGTWLSTPVTVFTGAKHPTSCADPDAPGRILYAAYKTGTLVGRISEQGTLGAEFTLQSGGAALAADDDSFSITPGIGTPDCRFVLLVTQSGNQNNFASGDDWLTWKAL